VVDSELPDYVLFMMNQGGEPTSGINPNPQEVIFNLYILFNCYPIRLTNFERFGLL
jgi:hypothetical protein